MELLVFGASGRVGRRLCACANDDGHRVTAFVRAGTAVSSADSVIAGDVTERSAVAPAVPGHDAVCVAVAPGEWDPAALTAGVENVLTAMVESGVDQFVAVATAGILQATPDRLRLTTPEFPDRRRRVAAAYRDILDRVRDAAVDWTLVCPPQMPDGAPTNHYRTAVDYLPEGGQSVSTGDVAAFVYETLVADRHRRQRVGIAY